MSAPYVYAPQVNYRNSPYLAPFYTQQNSPFIPELSLNNSPYASPYARAASLPPSPNLGNSPLPYIPSNVPFPSSPDGSLFAPNPWPRERRVSWNGAAPSTIQNTAWLQAPSSGYYHQRTRSDVGYNSYHPTSPYAPYMQLPPAQPPQFFLHPFLNAENPRSDFIFDVSAPEFLPMRYIGNNQTLPITADELNQVATHPPIYSLHIICDLIPNWPIDMNYNPTNGYSPIAPPIKLGDVLSAIWNSMQMRISQVHWASLTPQQQHMVSRAYTKRCQRMPSAEMIMLNQGVKQVDYLLGKIWFKGLLRAGDGFEVLKMVVA
ncbi:hypothetical protein GALMADRAFT_60384 [Galerina marginata CBS 339.88]|uniref:DUF6699 domain-containing protein n=1 Tax=Galerina marginata (strain CBS 339.88) TaxID=685588 RepID=A0A067TRF0_GALM3|nr:hypothetical protein GALMADRAFT_60384 [Galerina marginata CBS 339.88]